MNLSEAQHLAKALMKDFGIEDKGWRFAWDNAKRRHGQTRFSTKTISLSRPLTQINEDAVVENTIRHEIAHVLAGPSHGHDATWRAFARQCGAKPERCCSEGKSVEAPIEGRCSNPRCAHVHPRHRMPKAGVKHICAAPACQSAPRDVRIITWTRARSAR